MKNIALKLTLWGLMSLSALTMVAQNDGVSDNEFWGSADRYLFRQTTRTLKLVNEALAENLPVTGNTLSRRLALQNMDAILHDTLFDKSPELLGFLQNRIRGVIADLQKPLIADMNIYKLYNDGFIVKTPTVTVAFDVVTGSTFQMIPDTLMKRLVDQCDIMFISHKHPDHADAKVVKLFTDSGKQVVAPVEAFPNNQAVTHFRKEQIADLDIQLSRGKITLKVLPGHQDELQNNIYVITSPEGLVFAQTGDQYLDEDIPWLTKVKDVLPKIDVLIIDPWIMQLKNHIDGFDPALVITGHENELGHGIDHREAYWMSYMKLDEIERPYSLMTWGECYSYVRKR